jgi:hypothetical protein
MTHQRLNIGVYLNITQNMQRKPIANKYRKGTMKSTLYSTYILFTESVSAYTVIHKYTSSTGSERESEIALQIILTHMQHTYISLYATHTTIHMYDDIMCCLIYMSHTYIQRSTIGQSVFASLYFGTLTIAGYYVILTPHYMFCYTQHIYRFGLYVLSIRARSSAWWSHFRSHIRFRKSLS